MKKTKSFALKLSALSLILAGNAYAFNIAIDETHPVHSTILVTQSNKNTHLTSPERKPIVLMNIKLTPEQKKLITNYHPTYTKNNTTDTLPSSATVGMNNVPVLDQGRHGTCVTFATTAALDALIGKGDYVSQLCSLELGRYLKLKGFFPSGWSGSLAPTVFNQIERFGIINKATQASQSCAGMKEYVLDDEEEIGNAMTLEESKGISENVMDEIMEVPLLNIIERFNNDSVHPFNGEKVLNDVKSYLALSASGKQHSMIVFGVLLPDVPSCSAGACAKHNANFDTWALTDAITDDTQILGGHEMVITAYDDNATAVDNNGKIHKGLLTLRNSWSEKAGDQGNYYMTYDFFMKFIMDADRISG